MSSFRAIKQKIKNISNIKKTTEIVAKNLELLESFASNNENWNEAAIKNIKNQTSKLLCQLEKGSAVKLHKIIEKRKKQRKRRKLKQKLLKCAKKQNRKENQEKVPQKSLETTITSKSLAEKQQEFEKSLQTTKKATLPNKKDKVFAVEKPTTSKAAITTKISRKKQSKLSTPIKLHHQLRYQQQGQRFLRTFELLKMLHFARSQNATATREFNAKFDHLRAIWHKILTENTTNTTQTQQKIEDQWHEVFFGVKERVFYSIEQKQSDFLRIRRIWDTYLTRSHKHGTTIPTGWVLPKEEMCVDVRWLAYKK